MTHSQHSPQDLAAKEASAREMINERLELKRREREVLNVVVSWSLARGREWAVLESLDDLAILCGLQRPHVSRALLDLEEKKLLHRITQRGHVRLRFLSSGGDFIDPPQRVDPQQIAAIAEKMARLNTLPAGFELGGQKLLPLETTDERLANDLAQMSRERADDITSDPYRNGTADEIGTKSVRETCTESVRDPYQIGTEPEAGTAAPTRTRARHVHVPTSVPQSMVHVHEHVRRGAEGAGALRALNTRQLEERLDEEGRFWSGQLAGIFGAEGAQKFRRTWLLRFCDAWRIAAYKAVGETKRRIVAKEGFSKGPGEFCNDMFHRFKATDTAEAER